jgi:hypothetical protein
MRVALCTLVVAVFANGVGGALIFDSKAIILEDPRLRGLSLANLANIVGRNYWWPYTETALYRPLTTLSYLFNYAVLGNGTNAAGYHLVNIAIHSLNVLLLFAIAERLTRNLWTSLAIASLWAAHPIVTESVTNVVGRADLLSGLGVLGALWCHMRAGESTGTSRTWWRLGVMAASAVAMFSKEIGVVLIALLPLYDLLVTRRGLLQRDSIVGWMMPVVPLVLFVLARQSALAPVIVPIPFVDNPLVRADFWSARLTALAVIGRYVTRIVWPIGLSADYSFAQIPLATGTTSDWLAWSEVGALVLLCVYLVRANGTTAFTLLSGFLLLLPASNLIFMTGTIMAERLVYLPSIALIALIAVAVSSMTGRMPWRSRAIAAICAVVVAVFATLTIARNRVWHDEVSLWTDTVAVSPRSFKAHGALAEALYQSDATRENLPAVIAHKDRSLELLAGLPEPSLVLEPYREAATYYLERGDWLAAHQPGDETSRRFAYESAAKWARVYAAVLDDVRNSLNPPSTKQLAESQLLVSTAALRLNDTGSAVDAAQRGRHANPFAPAAYQAEAAAMIDARRVDDAAVSLLTGFMVTGDVSLREAAIDLYRGGLDRSGCAVRSGPAGTVLDQTCDIVKRHLCQASIEAAKIYSAVGRAGMASNVLASARQQFGCTGL